MIDQFKAYQKVADKNDRLRKEIEELKHSRSLADMYYNELAALRAEIEQAPVVYLVNGSICEYWVEAVNSDGAIHKARLVRIEPIGSKSEIKK